MKIVIFFLCLNCCLFCWGQQIVSNEVPHVSMDFKKYLYVGFENPVYITTGNIKSLKVSTDNGTITATGKKGSYLIKPENRGTATITLSGHNYKKTFTFKVWSMHFPTIRLVGQAGEHGIINIKSYSEGIMAHYTPADVDIEYQIDSFTVELRDSANTISHINIGALWDDTTKEMIRNAKRGSRILVYEVYMSRNNRKLKSDGYLESYIW